MVVEERRAGQVFRQGFRPASPCSSCGVPVVSSRIVGGTDAVIGEWPWQVAVIYNDYFICGGSLINTQWVLSAAEESLNANFQNTRRSSVEKIIINSQYSSAAGKWNIALVKMTNPVIYTDYILPICLPTMYVTFPTGMDCWVTGWGCLVPSSVKLQSPKTLQKVKIPVIDYEQCDQMYHVGTSISSYITIIESEKICAGYTEGGKDSCQGDSGGPLVCLMNGVWFQAGIVSWGDGCALAYRPGVYTLVPAYQSWIKAHQHLGGRESESPVIEVLKNWRRAECMPGMHM
uniref:Peptidase S1 domain-containing protein n=1 Tax=Leptobrachium leishanense TaxID=445787 RepID=A0A8C5Q1W2_9ANUR